jgi:tetratricopeptide (TPR) repeat protein
MAGAMKTGQVFVSHTADMTQFPAGRSFVQAALDAVGRAGMASVDMRYFAAQEVSPAEYCRRRVRECEIYVAVIGFRYGSLVAGEAVSYTELEFLAATDAGLPRLVFLLDKEASAPSMRDADDAPVVAFRRRLADAGLIVRTFTSGDGLELEIFHSLIELAGRGTALPAPSANDFSEPAHATVLDKHRGSESANFIETTPRIWNVPNRNTDFTGRKIVLDALHNDLSGAGKAVVVSRALYGLGGVGKTQVALEYAHRFKDDYDIVWWINAEQPQAISLTFAELAARLGIQASDDAADATAAALEELRRGAAGRWLVIFDNAGDLADLEPFLPAGAGHVIVTSRNSAWNHYAVPIELNVFSRAESDAHLMAHVPGLDSGDAARISAAVGELPLAVEQAAAWLAETGMPAALYIERLERQATSALALNKAFGYAMPVVAAWNLSFGRLEDRSPAAVQLLQILAFCSPEPISTTLLYGDEICAALLPFDETLHDRLMLGRVIQEASRLALIKVDQSRHTVQIHRLVQAVIRSQMTKKQQIDARHAVHRMLVGARPQQGQADDPAYWSAYDVIWPHLEPSQAEECDHDDTRELLIDWVRYQWMRGELQSGLTLARELEDLWASHLGADHQHTLQVQFEIANVLRAQGLLSEARSLDAHVVERQRVVLGPEHTHTLATANGLAADLRALGDFRQALDLDRKVYNSFRSQFGNDFPRTLMAAHNLACSLADTGDPLAARHLDDDTLARYQRVLGPSHPFTLITATYLARDMRETGAFQQSVDLMSITYETYCTLFGVEMFHTLFAANSLAVSLRRVGAPDKAMPLVKETHDCYERRHAPDLTDALSCKLNLAGTYSELGDHGRARELAAETRESYQSTLGSDHPSTLAAANNLAIYLCRHGDIEDALELAERTLAELSNSLGRDHPSSLICLIDLACFYGDTGNLVKAESLNREAISRLRRKLGPLHPETLACEANLAVTQHRTNQYGEAKRVRTQTLQRFSRIYSGHHPDVQLLRDWRYIHRDLEPLRV